MISFVAVL